MRDWSEERLVDVDLGVSVDRIVTDVEKLNDLGFWELFDDAFSGALILDKLAGNLNDKIRKWSNMSQTCFSETVDWEPTFFKDLIRGFAPVIARDDWVLLFMLV